VKKKILLVDDSTTSLFMEKMILKREPYDISTANDGFEAVEKALLEQPDLILMDVVMPRMNGFEALRALRGKDATRQTPVILVTTRSEPVNVAEGYASGCSDYLTKPIDPEELLTKVRSCLRGVEGADAR
jgi:DNA-binding response OmpR family regulator